MARLKADFDTWEAMFDRSGADPLVVFFCRSNGQRPYRVVGLEDDSLASPEDLESLSASDLAALFDRSESMNTSPS